MLIKERIEKDIIAGMKAKNSHLVETLRMIKTAIKNREVSGKEPTALTDIGVIEVLSTAIKQRNESSEAFRNGDRFDLAAKELQEIAFLEVYMPRQINELEIENAIKFVVSEHYKAAPTLKDLGKIIKEVQYNLRGDNLRADGKMLSQKVKDYLTTFTF